MAALYVSFSKKRDIIRTKDETPQKEWKHPDLIDSNYKVLYRFYEFSGSLSEQLFVLESENKNVLGNFSKKSFGNGFSINNLDAKVVTYKPNEIILASGEKCAEYRINIVIQDGTNIIAKVINHNNEKGYEIKYVNKNFTVLFKSVGGIVKDLLPAQFPAKIIIDDICIGLITRNDSTKLIADFSNKILIAGINDIDPDILLVCAIFSVVDFFPRQLLP